MPRGTFGFASDLGTSIDLGQEDSFSGENLEDFFEHVSFWERVSSVLDESLRVFYVDFSSPFSTPSAHGQDVFVYSMLSFEPGI